MHLFRTCTPVKKVWNYFQPTYQKLTKQQHTPQHTFTLSANNLSSKNKKLILTTQYDI